jgi:hypothetical protein
MIFNPRQRITAESPLEPFLEAYGAVPAILKAELRDVTQAEASAATRADAWSIAQIITHLLIANAYARQTFAGGSGPERGMHIMRPVPRQPLEALIETFRQERETVLAAMRNLRFEEWDAEWPYRTGKRTGRQLIAQFVRHDDTHLRQVRETLQSVRTMEV